MIAQNFYFLSVIAFIFVQNFYRLAQTDDARDIMGAGAQFVFLVTAVLDPPDAGTFSDIQHPRAFGTINFVRRHRQ